MAYVLGTAGHIDHGKTSLVRALTGQDTDRLKEEKARGISIDLGFAHLDLPDGGRAGVVDVPGHERFIRSMLAGAHGMDCVLFAVAADDGVMPQTEEHLDILHLLGVRRGVFAITKVDLVDPARVAAVREEIEILLLDTTLEGAPILPVSTVTGMGLEALRAAIAAALAAADVPTQGGPFRLPIDRAFVIHGHGVVVTGTAVAGTVTVGDTLRILPGSDSARVRSLEVHGIGTAHATRGQRVAVNLAGVDRSDLRRGHVACHPSIERTTRRLDAWVEVRPGAHHALKSHGRVRVHLGTAEVLAKLVTLGGATALTPRSAGWVQLVLGEPVVALRGDRLVVRDETARWTLAGGIVVNPFAERHRARDAVVAERLEVLRGADVAAAATTFLELTDEFASARSTLVQALNAADADISAALAGTPAVLAIPDDASPEAYTTARKWDRLRALVLEQVGGLHRAMPLAPGVEMESLRSGLPWDVPAKLFRWCCDRLVAAGALARDDSVVRLPTHAVALGGEAREAGERIERLLVDGRFAPPDLRQIEDLLALERKQLAAVLGVLEADGRVVRIAPELWYGREAADAALALVREHCSAHGEITAATFRDLIQASRKFAIAVLDWMDRTGETLRIGDVRRLRR